MFLFDCNYRGFMARFSDHFISSMYKIIFELDPPCMSQEVMYALLNIVDWYGSPDGTFIKMYNAEKAPHLLSNFSTDKLVM